MKKITIGADLAVLLARIIIGGIFVYSGWLKVIDMQMTLGMFSSMGIGAFLTYLVSYGEVVFGALLVLGIFTNIAAFFLLVVMFVAVYLTRGMGAQVFMTPLSFLAGLLAIWGAGPGKYSICKKS